MNEKTPAWAIAVWLDSISSFSMTGMPVSPIQASGCRRLGVVDDLPQLGEPIGVFREAARLFVLDQVQRQQPDVAVACSSLYPESKPIVVQGQQADISGKRRLVRRRARPSAAARIFSDWLCCCLRRRRGGAAWLAIAAIDLRGEPGDLPADVERVQVALEQALRLAQKAVDLLQAFAG